MPLVAKRKVRQTWREAVANRAAEQSPACATRSLAAFDGLVAGGAEEGEAAYKALQAERLLWLADEPGAGTPTQAEPGEVPAV